MKIKVTETFRYEGEEYEKGNTVNLPDSVAQSVIKKGYGEKAEGETKIGEIEKVEEETHKKTQKKKGPRWKRKIWISEDRNLTVTIWPSGEKFDSPSVTLEESRRDESGEWETNRLYLPTGSTLLALSENLKSAWQEIQKIRSGEKKKEE